jgi:mannose-6-phosphate isomerase
VKRQVLLDLPPNRVRRNYTGGRTLDAIEGSRDPRDGDRPEDWIASTIRAANPGLPEADDEGLSQLDDGAGGRLRLSDVLAADPEHYLGAEHVKRTGAHLGFLAKLLDSAMRLHVQAHPTAAFARRHLGSRWGKLESYCILGVRPGVEPYIRLGFQRPPTPEAWMRIVQEQDIPAMDACFDRVPVAPGEVWLIPGGLPHAIGEGLFLLEVMEPTDLVVRCEFEREGVIVPPGGRFMGRDPRLAMAIFDYTALPVVQAREKYRIIPRRTGPSEEQLIGPDQTDAFEISRVKTDARIELRPADRIRLGVVASGSGLIAIGDRRLALRPGARFLLAAAAPAAHLESDRNQPIEVLLCSPGRSR